MDNLNGSAIKIWTAVSGLPNGSGSTGPSNFAGYDFATVIFSAGSVDGGITLRVERSGTSNGTFAAFGASFPEIQSGASGSGITYVRSFSLDSSATFYRVVRDLDGTTQGGGAVIFMLQGARNVPITQDTRKAVTIYSDVLGG